MALDDGSKAVTPPAWRNCAEGRALQRQPLRAKTGANVTQMHYAKRGIITPRWNTWPCENGKREWMAQYHGRRRA